VTRRQKHNAPRGGGARANPSSDAAENSANLAAMQPTRGRRPDPPYPANTSARGFYFQLDYRRIVQSATWALAGPLGIRSKLLMLYFCAWQQIPAGALDNDDAIIAVLIEMPLAAFRKHRKTLMRGWWLASDGRLYHHFITTLVLDRVEWRAAESARQQRWRAAQEAREAREAQAVTRDSRVSHASVTRDNDPAVTRLSRVSHDAGAGAGATPQSKAPTVQPTTGVGVAARRRAAKSVSLRQRRNRG
jgi:hypothetical protein